MDVRSPSSVHVVARLYHYPYRGSSRRCGKRGEERRAISQTSLLMETSLRC